MGTARNPVVFNRLPLVGGYISGEFKSVYDIPPRGKYEHGGADLLVSNGPTLGARVVNPSAANSRVHSINAHGPDYGLHVVLDHPQTDQWTLYAHLSAIDCEVNDVLPPGAAIGLAGATGFVTGPHVHWELADDATRPSFGAIRSAPDAQGIARLIAPTLRNPRDYLQIVTGPIVVPATMSLADVIASLNNLNQVVIDMKADSKTRDDKMVAVLTDILETLR